MSLTDPIADMLTMIRNANRVHHKQVDVKNSNLNKAILNIFKRERYIYDYKLIEDEKQGILRVYLKAPSGLDESVRIRPIHQIVRVSKPGLRRYSESKMIPRVLNGIGVCVVSTSRGVMTGDDARKKGVGGELLLKIW